MNLDCYGAQNRRQATIIGKKIQAFGCNSWVPTPCEVVLMDLLYAAGNKPVLFQVEHVCNQLIGSFFIKIVGELSLRHAVWICIGKLGQNFSLQLATKSHSEAPVMMGWLRSSEYVANPLPDRQLVGGVEASLQVGVILGSLSQSLNFVRLLCIEPVQLSVGGGGINLPAHELLSQFDIASAKLFVRSRFVAGIDHIIQNRYQRECHARCDGPVVLSGENSRHGGRAAGERAEAQDGANASVAAGVQSAESDVVVDFALNDIGVAFGHEISPASRVSISAKAVLALLVWAAALPAASLLARRSMSDWGVLELLARLFPFVSWSPRCVTDWFGDYILACRQGAAISQEGLRI